MPPGYIYRHKIPILISIWQTIYGVVSVYENRVIAEETINDPQNPPFIAIEERWSQKRRDSKRSDWNRSVVFKSFSTIFIRHTKQVFPFSSANQAVKQATCRIHLLKGGAKNEIYVFDYRRREKFALH